MVVEHAIVTNNQAVSHGKEVLERNIKTPARQPAAEGKPDRDPIILLYIFLDLDLCVGNGRENTFICPLDIGTALARSTEI